LIFCGGGERSGGGVRDRWKAEVGLIVDSSREIIKVM